MHLKSAYLPSQSTSQVFSRRLFYQTTVQACNPSSREIQYRIPHLRCHRLGGIKYHAHIVGVCLVRVVTDVERRDALVALLREFGLEPLRVVPALDERATTDGDGNV